MTELCLAFSRGARETADLVEKIVFPVLAFRDPQRNRKRTEPKQEDAECAHILSFTACDILGNTRALAAPPPVVTSAAAGDVARMGWYVARVACGSFAFEFQWLLRSLITATALRIE